MQLADVHVGKRCVYSLSQRAKYSKATKNTVTLQQLMNKKVKLQQFTANNPKCSKAMEYIFNISFNV